MLNVVVAFALSTVPVPATAGGPEIVVATNAESASGFDDLADCENSLVGSDIPSSNVIADGKTSLRGSLFNRTAGNLSRCELVDGEALVVVYPRRR